MKKEMHMASAKSITKHPAMQTVEALQRQAAMRINVPPPERVLSTFGGGALAFSGLKRRGWPGVLRAMLGGLLLYRGISGHSFIYQALHINRAEYPFPSINISAIPEREGFRVQRSLTINRKPQEVYAFWHSIEDIPRFMPMVQSVQKIDEKRSYWIAYGPTGQKLEWDVEITQDQPGRVIAWQVRNHRGMMMEDGGRASFREAPRQRGTIVTLEAGHKGLQNMLEMPLVGKVAGFLLESRVLETLRRFKAILETGEVPTLVGQPTGRPSQKGA
jgi:uncharacterized membrane protein